MAVGDGEILAHVCVRRCRKAREFGQHAGIEHDDQGRCDDVRVVRMAAQEFDGHFAAEHGIHMREPGQERRHFRWREREHQRADRLARDVGAGVDQQPRHRLAGPALTLGKLVHDAGHRALRVDLHERRGGVERHQRIRRTELLLQRLPGRRIVQVSERADREDAPSDPPRVDVTSRRDVEAELQRELR